VLLNDIVESLKGCFLFSDFHSDDIDKTTMVTMDYIKFCTDNVVHKKELITNANNKPHITKEIIKCKKIYIQSCINKKKLAFHNQYHPTV